MVVPVISVLLSVSKPVTPLELSEAQCLSPLVDLPHLVHDPHGPSYIRTILFCKADYYSFTWIGHISPHPFGCR